MSEEKRIVVEIFSHPEAERLRQEMRQQDEIHRAEICRWKLVWRVCTGLSMSIWILFARRNDRVVGRISPLPP